jgi:chemotaxis signal transduction protein
MCRKSYDLTVDSVASVEALAADTIEDATPAMGGVKSDLLGKVARRAEGKGIVFLLDAETLLRGHA